MPTRLARCLWFYTGIMNWIFISLAALWLMLGAALNILDREVFAIACLFLAACYVALAWSNNKR